MKEAIGGTWIFGIVITFVIFFSGYVSISLNYSKVYKVKDEIIIFLQNYNGLNKDSINAINEYVNGVGYRNYGDCPIETKDKGVGGEAGCFFGVDARNTDVVKKVSEVNYCVEKINTSANSAYYQVTLFFRIDLPVVRQMFAMNIQGETAALMSPDEVSALADSCKVGG